MIGTRPATALGDGTARQCGNCLDDLAIGSPCALNSRRVECHPECADQGRLAATLGRNASRGKPAAVAVDIGDLVADIICGVTTSTTASTGAIAAPTSGATASAAVEAPDFSDLVADAYDRMRGHTPVVP